MQVKNPRRVLAVSLADSTQHLSRVIKDLTGSHPEPASTTLAGTTHLLSLKTSYYTADVPIWLDLISSPAEWSASFLSPEAKEVLTVLGGLAVVFSLPSASSSASSSGVAAPIADASPAVPTTTTTTATPAAPPSADETRALITEVGRVVREGLGGWGWDGVGLGIGVGEGEAEEWEELCAEWGLEFVQIRGGKKDDGKNEFGEKMGIARVLDALESNDWDAADDLDGGLSDRDSDVDAASGLPRKRKPLADGRGDGDDFDLDPESLDFGFDKSDFEGLKKAIWDLEQDEERDADAHDEEGGRKATEGGAPGGRKTVEDAGKDTGGNKVEDEGDEELDGDKVEKIERMMRKLQAVRDMSAGLPEEQRRRMAKKAVGEVMKEL
ncbi:hypothetical protein CSHISOI_01481 [Colletotrichum shisoi]|uniref:Increased recombination centers protein 6 n=1 Tax=Colletotrichum shisoi TaxID=2078593 RepID=A0A5Q4C3R5_9PEZI|nr:hypothetical protein CSHISOI_01481 [Colletotrichum shisoi]